jgi:hypothetical protein
MRKRHCLLVVLALTSACTTARTNHIKALAEVGRSFETAVDKVVDQASDLNVDANSQMLLEGRSDNRDDRRKTLEANNAEMVRANRIYADLKKQNALLSDYFTALGALASFDGESAIGTSTQSLVTSLQALSPRLQGITIGNAPVASVVGAAAPLIVSGIKSRRLAEELRRNGPIINEQLDLQSKLLDALAEDIAEDQNVLAQNQLLERIYVPYIEASNVPAGWIADRRAILRQQAVVAAPAAEAAQLSRKLKLAFAATAEGRLDPSDLAADAADLGRLVSLIETVAKPAAGGK